MSAVNEQSAMGTVPADPAAILPTTMASEAIADPIRPSGTDALTPESRPEVAATLENTAAAPVTESVAKEDDVTMSESQPMTEGVLGYKAPGLVKYILITSRILNGCADNFVGVCVSRRNTFGLVMKPLSHNH